ncbi:MAG: oligosaccharide flippase family protein, partial [bacterium]
MLTYLKQLAGETVIYGIANILSKSIAILLLPIYAAEFSPGEFGRISIITTTVSIFTILAVMGLDNSAHRWFWDSEDESFRKRVISSWFWSQLIIAIVLGLVLFAFSSLYLDIVLKNAVSTDVIFIALLCIPLTTFSKILTGWLRMQRRPLPTILFALLFTSTNLVMAIILVKYLKLGLVGVFAAQVVGAAMGGIFSVLLLKDWINPKHFSFTILKPMLIYGMPLVPGGIALWISASSDRYFLQFLSTPEELGLYSFGAMIAAVVGIVVSAFQMA